jgi:hypothetical protein
MMKFRQYLKEQRLLLEDRLGKIKDIFKDNIDSSHDTLGTHKTSDAIVDHFANHADPTKNKEYTQWIVNKYRQKNFRQEDHPRIKEAISNFHKHKSKLEHKDINKYKSISDIEDAVEPHLEEAVSKKEEKRQVKSEGADLIHSGSGVTIHHIKTKDAACAYGAGTKWCTSGEKNNMFDSYNKTGPIHVIQHQGRKYQFHNKSEQLMDEKDNEVKLSDVHPDIQKEMIKSDHPEVSKANLYFNNPHLTEKHIDTAIKDNDPQVRRRAIYHHSASPEHLTYVMENDPSEENRISALYHDDVSMDHVKIGLKDSHPDVRSFARQIGKVFNPNFDDFD